MGLTEVCQDEENGAPDKDEEDNDKDEDLPFGNGDIPEEAPVTTIGLRVPSVEISTDNLECHSLNSTSSLAISPKSKTK